MAACSSNSSSTSTTNDDSPMFGSLLRLADAKSTTRQLLTRDWWQIIPIWYPNMHKKIYCVPPVHFYHVAYKPREEDPNQQQPHERAGFRVVRPVAYTDVVDDEAQQRVLRTLVTFAERQGFVVFILSNVEFQNYLNKAYDVAPGVDNPPKLTSNEEGEMDVLVMDKQHGIFVLEIKGTGYRPNFPLMDCEKPLEKIAKQLTKDDDVVRKVLSDLDQNQEIKIRKGCLFPYLKKAALERALQIYPNVEQELRKSIECNDLNQLLDCCLCSDDLPPKDKDPVDTMTPEIVDKINRFWCTLQDVTGHMVQPIKEEVYEQIVARFAGHLSTVKIYTEKTMPRVRLELTPTNPSSGKKKNPKLKVGSAKVIPVECRTVADATREAAGRFSELVLLPDQIDLLQAAEDFVHIEGSPGTGKTLMLLLRILTWLDGNNLVYLLSLSPASRSIIHVLYEQVEYMLIEHKGETEAKNIKKKLHIFVPTRPGHTLNEKYIEQELHKWRNRTKGNGTDDKKLCLVLDETGMAGKGLEAFFNQISKSHKQKEFTSGNFTAGLSVWSASVEKCGRPCYVREPQEPRTLDKFGICRKLTMPLRCPPTVQRALMLVQSDLDEDNVCVFQKEHILPNPLQAPPNPKNPTALPECFQYPTDGLPVYLVAHGSHKKAMKEVWFCEECGDDLADYLSNKLQIGQKKPKVSDVPLRQRDVLIVATQSAFSKSLPADGFLVALRRNLQVTICRPREDGTAPMPPDDIILVADLTSVHGLERAVVVVIPEHPNASPPSDDDTDDDDDDGDDEVDDIDNRVDDEEDNAVTRAGPEQATDTEMPETSPDLTGETATEEPMVEDDSVIAESTSPVVSAAGDSNQSLEAQTDASDSKSDQPTSRVHVACSTAYPSESEITAAFKTLTDQARKDIFYIGSRTVCQLIVIHFGKKEAQDGNST